MVGPLAVDYPEHGGARGAAGGWICEAARAGAWPAASEGGGVWARLVEGLSRPEGFVKLELVDDDGARESRSQISRDVHDALAPKVGERLYVKPRKLRVFLSTP